MTDTAGKTTKIGPYSRPAALAKLDQRTREARLIRETRQELVKHVGGSPSATQAALIESLVQLKLRLAVMDRKFSQAGPMTDHDGRQYLAFTNGFARGLARLGMKSSADRSALTLAQYLSAKANAPSDASAPARAA